MAQHNKNTIIAELSQNIPSHVSDNLYSIKKFNKSIFFRFLKISIAVSVLMSFFFLIGGYFYEFVIILISGFFGTFLILAFFFYIERIYEMILNKIKRKKTEM